MFQVSSRFNKIGNVEGMYRQMQIVLSQYKMAFEMFSYDVNICCLKFLEKFVCCKGNGQVFIKAYETGIGASVFSYVLYTRAHELSLSSHAYIIMK